MIQALTGTSIHVCAKRSACLSVVKSEPRAKRNAETQLAQLDGCQRIQAYRSLCGATTHQGPRDGAFHGSFRGAMAALVLIHFDGIFPWKSTIMLFRATPIGPWPWKAPDRMRISR